jgi:mono/diheme cytochrome c family protein
MKHKRLVAGTVLGALLALGVSLSGQSGSQPAAAPTPVPVRSSVSTPSAPLVSSPVAAGALFKQYCVACHNERAKVAGLDSSRKLALDGLDLAHVPQNAADWERVVRKMRAGMMPPIGSPRPDKATFESLMSWVEQEIDRAATPYTPAPGLHRLNRTEYANVVRDLLGVEIDAAKYLPSDDSTSGFDNIAGALGLSSTLVEAYVSAAQKISRLALGRPEEPTLVVYRTPEDTTQDYHIEGLPFGTRGGILARHVFPSEGEYVATVTPIFGDNMSPAGFGSVPCEKIEILLDGERLVFVDWQGGGRAPSANCGGKRQAEARSGQAGPEAFFGGAGGTPMRARFKTTAGLHTVGATFPQTNLAPVLDLDKHFMRSTVQTGPTPGYTFFPHVGTIRIEGPFEAVPANDSPSRRKIFVCTPTGAADEASCARRIVTTVATNAFRRPAGPADIDLLMGFFNTGRRDGSFDDGVELVLSRVLASPQFLYRIEEEPAAAARAGQAHRISDIDLASRLSFFLWSSGPDEELLRVAVQGRLKDAVVLERQVLRMLKDPRAEALAVNFAGQWLNLRGLQSVGPLPLVYPDFDDPLRQAMRREVELFFDSIVREDRNVADLLDARDTFVNERLARHYGIPHIYGSSFRRVTLGPEFDVRRGLLGKGAFLTTTSKPDRTSPVTRGKWVMTNVLGMSPPDPPADVPPLPPSTQDATGNVKTPTMREKMLAHRVRADCVQCHRMMDPIGFALENFDAIALWRTTDEGTPIDPTGQVFDSTRIDGPAALRTWLTGYSDQFVAVVAEKLLTYGLGRGAESRDMPLVRAIARDARAKGNRFSALVLGVAKSQPFSMNTSAVEAPTTRSTSE